METWISVKDRLPIERIQHCLVFNGTAPLYNQCVFAAVWFSQTEKFKPEYNHDYMGDITHWMPMPPPPEPKQQ